MDDSAPNSVKKPIQDLREWLARIEEIGELVRIDKPVERDEEVVTVRRGVGGHVAVDLPRDDEVDQRLHEVTCLGQAHRVDIHQSDGAVLQRRRQGGDRLVHEVGPARPHKQVGGQAAGALVVTGAQAGRSEQPDLKCNVGQSQGETGDQRHAHEYPHRFGDIDGLESLYAPDRPGQNIDDLGGKGCADANTDHQGNDHAE